MEEENKLSPELRDIIENIKRYSATNKNEAIFVYGFIGFKKDPEHKCIDCGEDYDQVSDEKSTFGAYGDINNVRMLLNDLRDFVEDSVDEDGFVNF
jgi:hypothetical protein